MAKINYKKESEYYRVKYNSSRKKNKIYGWCLFVLVFIIVEAVLVLPYIYNNISEDGWCADRTSTHFPEYKYYARKKLVQ